MRAFPACALAYAVLLGTGCSGGSQHAAGSTVRTSVSPSSAPSSPAPSSCEATVLVLLSESAVAAQDGYPSGLSPETVMTRYGEQSAVFQAWEQLDGQVLAYQEEHGPFGLLTTFVSPAASLCSEYGG